MEDKVFYRKFLTCKHNTIALYSCFREFLKRLGRMRNNYLYYLLILYQYTCLPNFFKEGRLAHIFYPICAQSLAI